MATTGDELTPIELIALGRAVRAARIRAGHRHVQDLADLADVSRKTLGKLERGESVAESTILAVEPHIGWVGDEWLRHAREGGTVGPRPEDVGVNRKGDDEELAREVVQTMGKAIEDAFGILSKTVADLSRRVGADDE